MKEKLSEYFAKQLLKRLAPFIEEENDKKYIGGLRIEGIILSITQSVEDLIFEIKQDLGSESNRPFEERFWEIINDKQALPEKKNNKLNNVFTKNIHNQFVPSIPEPFFLSFGRVKCECGQKFKNKKLYRQHYALEHILGLN